MIFAEIRADHTQDGLKVDFLPRGTWAPYVEAVLAKPPNQGASGQSAGYHISSPDGGQEHGCDNAARLVQDARGWLRLTG